MPSYPIRTHTLISPPKEKKMALNKLLLTATALPLLAACAASNGTSNVGDYLSATTADGTLEEVITSTGVKGFVGNSDGTVSEVRVRIDMSDPSSPAFYLSRDGGPEENFYIEETPVAALMLEEPILAGSYTLINDDGDTLDLVLDEADFAYLNLERASEFSRGSFGLQTETANLPTSTAYYSGGFNFGTDDGTYRIGGGGYLELTVDFDDGGLIGYSGGGFDISSDELELYDGGGFDGVVIGEVSGSEMTATMNVLGSASGEFDMKGAFYGETGSELAGGMGGTLSTDYGDFGVGGSFELYGGGLEECFECIR